MPADGAEIIRRFNRLKADAQTHFARCEEMAPYLAPSRTGILSKRQPGEKQTRGVYDSTAMEAAELFAMFMAGRTINPADRWLLYQMADPRIRGLDPVREWMDECRDRSLQRLANSAFYGEAPESLVDWVGFGTNFLLIDEQPQPVNQTIRGFRGFHVRAEKTGRFLVAEGADGLVDTGFCEYPMTARTVRDRWPGAPLPETVQGALRDNQVDKPFEIVHAIYPRPKAERKPGAAGMPWASCWVEKQSKAVVWESGYMIFPVAVGRYKRTPGEVFGRGPGDIAFPDAWTLNSAKKLGLEDFALKLKPPMLMAHDSVVGTLRLIPGGPTTVNTHGRPIRDVIGPLETGSRPEVSHLKTEELRRAIREIFYVELILQLLQVQKSEMTAFEYGQKLTMLFRILATPYGILKREFLKAIVDIIFTFQYYAGDFPPAPPEVDQSDGNVQVEFENPIEKAQRYDDTEALTLSFGDLQGVGQLHPEVFDWIDVDKTASGVFDARGVPAKWLRNADEVAAVRRARQQQNEAEIAAGHGKDIAEMMKGAAPMLRAVQQQPAGAGR